MAHNKFNLNVIYLSRIQVQSFRQNVEGNTVRDYFKDTATAHFFNVAIRCMVLIKTAFSQARHPSSSFLRDKMA